MRFRWIASIVFVLVGFWGPSTEARTEICAADSLGLKQTPALDQFRSYFDTGFGPARVGLVNETSGSYVLLDFAGETMTMTFFTSGLFNLVPIKREGSVRFCDEASLLTMRGLGVDEEIKIVGGKVVIDEGGARKTFVKGPMPKALAELHHYTDRAIAADHP